MIAFNSPIGNITIVKKDGKISEVRFDEEINKYSQASDSLLLKAALQIKEYFNRERVFFDLPLIMNGTEFQKRVWIEIQKIPYGKTCSYEQIALALGNKNKVRAVANACNKNPLPIIIPCHRVIGKNGDLTGYNGGLEKKKFLLIWESSNNDK